MPSLLDLNYPRIITVLAIIFGISLGLCGLTAVVSNSLGPNVVYLGIIELIGMIVSGVGILITLLAWVLSSALGGSGSKHSEPQRLFDESDKNDQGK